MNKNIINQSNLKFETMQPYPSLNMMVIRDPRHDRVVGYVQKVPDVGWCWYSNANFSRGFNSSDEAIDDLLKSYVITIMDNQAKIGGVYDDERYTKGR